MDTNKERFDALCDALFAPEAVRGKIGTYFEKTIHALLKNYLEPQSQFHEIKVGAFCADIKNDDGIIEIQTASFERLCKKLSCFLPLYPVKIVYPVPAQKYLVWVDPETGHATLPRKCPRIRHEYKIFNELWKIADFLCNESLSILIVKINLVEEKMLDGYSKDKKHGAHRIERYPTSLDCEININSLSDYRVFIPETLSEEFTVKEFKTSAKISQKTAYNTLRVLTKLGVLETAGKRCRANLYKLSNKF